MAVRRTSSSAGKSSSTLRTLLLGGSSSSSGPSSSSSSCAADTTIEINDPTGGGYRTIQFAIFQTMSPTMRITLTPPINPPQATFADARDGFKVFVDDGEDDSDDALDITSLFVFSGGVAIASIPAVVAIGTYPGNIQAQFRALVDDPNSARIMYFGENRLQFLLYGMLCFEARFLHYDSPENVVVGTNYGAEPLPDDEFEEMASNHILLNFDPAATDAGISQFLLSQSLRPQGIDREFGTLQVRDLSDLKGSDLENRAAALNTAMGGSPGQATIDPLAQPWQAAPPTTAGEDYPVPFNAAFVAQPGQPGSGTWGDEQAQLIAAHQHWEMQTAAAQRLIDVIIQYQPIIPSIQVFLLDTGFGNGQDFSATPFAGNNLFVTGWRLRYATFVGARNSNGSANVEGRSVRVYPRQSGENQFGVLTNVKDYQSLPNGHGTGVLSALAGDGVGTGGLTLSQVVLGTGKDVFVRPVLSTREHLASQLALKLVHCHAMILG
ncbi:MAG TPA: hypothetical protein VFC78_12490 [Tepidisphaeraceae bacterium]|nr:hypothetical protein [Tepidisphaeraceae bacterium]